MDIILVPGLWLDAASWDDVLPILRTSGHTPHALTMPGAGATGDASADIGMADWVDAVVKEIDAIEGPVVLVGHSGGGNVVYGAVDARPDRVARVIYLDTIPPADGDGITEFPVVDGVVPFPGWDHFEPAEVGDLDADTRERRAAATVSVPARVPTDAIALRDERRRAVPATIIMTSYPSDQLRADVTSGAAWAAELAALLDLEIVGLDAGHWPQFSVPDQVGEAIVAAASR